MKKPYEAPLLEITLFDVTMEVETSDNIDDPALDIGGGNSNWWD